MLARYFGYNQLFVGGPQKIMSRQEDERLISNDILNNLLIIPGELPFRPSFGVNLRNFVFEKLDGNDISILESEIASQLLRNDPRLIIKQLRLVPNPDSAQLEITILVTLKEDPNKTIEIKRLIRTLSSNKQ